MSNFPENIKSIEREDDLRPESEIAGETGFDDVDLSVLLDFAEVQGEDEPDLIVELIDLYLADFPQQLSVMKNGVAEADEDALKRAAHTLKGSSVNLGVNGVAALCEELQETDSSASFQRSNDLIDRLEQTFARVRRIFLDERARRV